MARLARAIAEEMGRPEEEVLGAYYAGLVHDVGQISIPAEILSYPGKLGKEELGIIRKHPETGSQIVMSESIRTHARPARLGLEDRACSCPSGMA